MLNYQHQPVKPQLKLHKLRSKAERDDIKRRYDEIESDLQRLLKDLQDVKMASRALESHSFH